MKVGSIKIRPVVLVIATGLVVALNVLLFTQELTVVTIALAGNIITGIVGVASKLIESEEKGK